MAIAFNTSKYNHTHNQSSRTNRKRSQKHIPNTEQYTCTRKKYYKQYSQSLILLSAHTLVSSRIIFTTYQMHHDRATIKYYTQPNSLRTCRPAKGLFDTCTRPPSRLPDESIYYRQLLSGTRRTLSSAISSHLKDVFITSFIVLNFPLNASKVYSLLSLGLLRLNLVE